MSIAYKIEFDNSKKVNFSEMISEIFDGLMNCGQEIVKTYLEEADERLLEGRDKKRYRCKGRRKTAVKTKLGTVEYERRIYLDTEQYKHVYLLDESIAAQHIGLVDEQMSNSISDMICVMPYRRVAETISETTGLDISHQAVWNIVQKQGQRQIEKNDELAKLVKEHMPSGCVETKLLYEPVNVNESCPSCSTLRQTKAHGKKYKNLFFQEKYSTNSR